MYMTEKEAKEKWCPMARVQWEGSAYNRCHGHGNFPEAAKCLGKKCIIFYPAGRDVESNTQFYRCGLGG